MRRIKAERGKAYACAGKHPVIKRIAYKKAEREKRRGQKQITDPALLRRIILFLADNIGSNVSAASIGNTLVNEGLLEDGKRRGAPSTHLLLYPAQKG